MSAMDGMMHEKEEVMKLSLILLASGWSRRLGRNKLLEPLGDRLMAEYALATAESFCRRCREENIHIEGILVTRYPAVAALAEARGFSVVQNPDPDQSDSVKHGLRACAEDTEACLFMSCDQPFLSAESLRRLAAAFRKDPTRPYRLSFAGDPAMPTIFPRELFPRLLALTGDRGGGAILRDPAVHTGLVEAGSARELTDIDTEEALTAAAVLLQTAEEQRHV